MTGTRTEAAASGAPAVPALAGDRGAERRARRLVVGINTAKLCALAALVPPSTVGIAQRAAALDAEAAHVIVGVVGAAGSLGAIAGALLFGRAADLGRGSLRLRWLVAAAGAATLLAGVLLTALAPTPTLLGAGWLLAECGATGAMAVLRSLLAHALPTQRRRGATVMVLIGYLGAMLPLILLLILPAAVWETAAGLALLAVIVPAAALAALRRRRATPGRARVAPAADAAPRSADGATPAEPDAAGGPPGDPAPRPGRPIPWWGILLTHLASSATVSAYLAYHTLDVAARFAGGWGDGTVRAGVIVLVAALAGLLAAVLLLLARPALMSRPRALLVAAGLALAASVAARAATEHLPVLLAAVLVSGAAVGATTAVLLAAAVEGAPAARAGRRLGLYSAAAPLGQLLGPPLALGVLAAAPGDGYRALYLVLAGPPLLWSAALLAGGLRRGAARRGRTPGAPAGDPLRRATP